MSSPATSGAILSGRSTPPPATPAGGAAGATPRLASIDLIRGAVMILMALDHVRVYSGVPAGGPDPAVFFTRWVTHFCAPAFVFLAGTSAFLHGQRLGDPARLSRWLLTRGAFLVVIELTVLRAAWTFNLDSSHLFAGVIWMLGWCMILMAALVRLPAVASAACGLLLIGGHDLVDAHLAQLAPAAADDRLAWLWRLLYFGGVIKLGGGGARLAVLYSLVPWIGVMAAGYGFGAVMRLEAGRRRRLCLQLGLGATALFLVLRGFNLYGNPWPWGYLNPSPAGSSPARLSALLSFLNVNKYPASLQFLLMTLGPTIALIPALARVGGAPTETVATFGRVPLFFYLLHIPLIHTVALGVSLARTGAVDPWLFADHPMMVPPPPHGYAWSLPLLYLVWAGVIVALYFPCRWYARVKQTRQAAWLSYL